MGDYSRPFPGGFDHTRSIRKHRFETSRRRTALGQASLNRDDIDTEEVSDTKGLKRVHDIVTTDQGEPNLN